MAGRRIRDGLSHRWDCGRLNATVERPDNPSIRGMVTKIRHLVEVEEVPARAGGRRKLSDVAASGRRKPALLARIALMRNETMPLTLDDLRGGPGAHREKKRVGRGHGSGKGKTAGRGTKGQKSRSGPGVRRGFEGGQLPIQQRMPYKRGFTNIYKAPWEVVNLGRLEELDVDGPITPEVLYARGRDPGLEVPGQDPGRRRADADDRRPCARVLRQRPGQPIEQLGGSVAELERTDDWLQARPRSRRLPLNRELKKARVGKVGGPTRREALAALERRARRPSPCWRPSLTAFRIPDLRTKILFTLSACS